MRCLFLLVIFFVWQICGMLSVRTMKLKNSGIDLGLGLTAAVMVASPLLQAELILLEQFDYEGVDTLFNGFDGGQGFDGAWELVGWGRPYDIGRTVYAVGDSSLIVNDRGGLDLVGHPSAGSALGRFGTAGQQEVHRNLTSDAQAALTADNSTIWFSVLACAPSGNKFGTLIFGTDPMIAIPGSSENGNLSSPTGQAFGVGFRTDNGGLFGSGVGSPNAVAFVNSSSATVAVGNYVPPFVDGSSHHDASLIVGKINWKANGTDDELLLFNIVPGVSTEPVDGDAIASLEADFDQSNFSLLSLQDTGATIFDEIRFGTTFSDVAPGAGPIVPLTISEFDYSPATRQVSLTWNSKPGKFYIIKYSSDMVDWTSDIDDSAAADAGEFTTKVYNLGAVFGEAPTKVFFRVEEAP